MTTVETVTLSDAGVALLLLDHELTNNGLQMTRLLRRKLEIEDQLALVRTQRRNIEDAIQSIKARI